MLLEMSCFVDNSYIQKILSNHLFLAFLLIFHLCISLINYDFFDWKSQWYAISSIVDGIDLYALDMTEINGQVIFPPYHFPVFFYLMGFLLKLTIKSPIIVRVFLYFCNIGIIYIFTREEVQKIKAANLFLLSPVLISIEYTGKYDQFVMLMVLISFYFIKKQKFALGGFTIGLAVMSKIFIILIAAILGIYLLKYEIKYFLSFSISFLIPVLSIFFYFYHKFGDMFLEMVFYWQSIRFDPSSSIWRVIIPFEAASILSNIQIGIIFITFLVILLRVKFQNSMQIENLSLIIIILFLLTSRIVFPHYIFWIFSLGFKFMYQKDNFSRWYFLVIISFIGGGMWSLFHDFYNIKVLQIIGSVIQTIGLILLFILHGNLYLKSKYTCNNYA